MSYRETEFMLIGALDGVRETPAAMAASSAVTRSPGSATKAAEPANSFSVLDGFDTCNAETSAISPANLVNIVATSTRGDFGAIGPYVCDGQGNCGRSLGRYQLMSYQPEVRTAIKYQPGGDDFLKQLNSGASMDGADLGRFFPVAAQTQLVEVELTKALEQAESEGLGGEGVPARSRISDVHGKALSPTANSSLCLAGGGTP
jgi:hypothetical protein